MPYVITDEAIIAKKLYDMNYKGTSKQLARMIACGYTFENIQEWYATYRNSKHKKKTDSPYYQNLRKNLDIACEGLDLDILTQREMQRRFLETPFEFVF